MGVKIQKSFTLIEMVVVVGVFGFALPILFAIIFLILRQQMRIYSLQDLKKQGDNAFYSIQSTIKDRGVTVIANPTLFPLPPYPTIVDNCPIYPTPSPTPAPYIYLYDKDSHIFSYGVSSSLIASYSAFTSTSMFLTNSKVKIDEPDKDFLFTCSRTNQFSPPIIWTYLKITQNTNVDPTPSFMQYSTKFQLRSY